jgi:hypothetical protein
MTRFMTPDELHEFVARLDSRIREIDDEFQEAYISHERYTSLWQERKSLEQQLEDARRSFRVARQNELIPSHSIQIAS